MLAYISRQPTSRTTCVLFGRRTPTFPSGERGKVPSRGRFRWSQRSRVKTKKWKSQYDIPTHCTSVLTVPDVYTAVLLYVVGWVGEWVGGWGWCMVGGSGGRYRRVSNHRISFSKVGGHQSNFYLRDLRDVLCGWRNRCSTYGSVFFTESRYICIST